MSESILLQPLEPELTFCVDELPLLTAQITLPRWEGKRGTHFNRYYRSCAEHFQRTCRREFLPRVEEAYRRAREDSLTLPQWQARLCSIMTLQREHLVSLRSDTLLIGSPQQYATRQGDTWDLRCGLPLSLPACFPPHTPWRKRLLELACDQIRDWEAQGVARYHDNWFRQIRRAFHPHNFYLTEEGLCFFFPRASIAPAVEGFPTFCLSYDPQAGPFVPNR